MGYVPSSGEVRLSQPHERALWDSNRSYHRWRWISGSSLPAGHIQRARGGHPCRHRDRWLAKGLANRSAGSHEKSHRGRPNASMRVRSRSMAKHIERWSCIPAQGFTAEAGGAMAFECRFSRLLHVAAAFRHESLRRRPLPSPAAVAVRLFTVWYRQTTGGHHAVSVSPRLCQDRI